MIIVDQCLKWNNKCLDALTQAPSSPFSPSPLADTDSPVRGILPSLLFSYFSYRPILSPSPLLPLRSHVISCHFAVVASQRLAACMDESVMSNTFCLSRRVADCHPTDQSTGRCCPTSIFVVFHGFSRLPRDLPSPLEVGRLKYSWGSGERRKLVTGSEAEPRGKSNSVHFSLII